MESGTPAGGTTTTRHGRLTWPGDAVLLAAALVVYCGIIFYHIDRFPLYFFADEAIPGVDAYAIAHTGADHTGKRFPLFFEGLGEYPLSLTVYLQVPLIAAAGKTVWAVRTTTALLSLLGVAALYFTLKRSFRSAVASLTPLLLGVSPFWFLHSRTGFEYVPATAFFLCFLYFTLQSLERGGAPVVLAAVSAAAAFYSYTPGRGWVVVAVALTTVFLAPTHAGLWRRWLLFLGVLALLLAPYAYLQLTHPEIALRRLEAAGFADFRNLPILGKIEHFGREYLRALDPRFWFTWSGTPHDGPMQRHVIPELPLVPIWLAPFTLLGFLLCLRRIRRPEPRLLLAFVLAVPVPASLLTIDNHRCLPIGAFMILFAGIGLNALYGRLPVSGASRSVVTVSLTAVLAGYALWFGSYARNDSIRRYSDYGFYGVQIGSPQVFTWIRRNSERFAAFRVGSNLFNMGDVFAWFFLPPATSGKVKTVDLDDLCRARLDWAQGTAFFVPAAFPEQTRSTGCPIAFQELFAVRDPLGRAVIRSMSLTKETGFDAWAEAAVKKSLAPATETVPAYGHLVTVEHPPFDIGSAADLFDNDSATITRTHQVNPARYLIRFRAVLPLRAIGVELANTTEADVTVTTRDPSGVVAWGLQHYSRARGDAPMLVFRRASPTPVSTVTIDVHLTDQGQFAYVHLSGITWR